MNDSVDLVCRVRSACVRLVGAVVLVWMAGAVSAAAGERSPSAWFWQFLGAPSGVTGVEQIFVDPVDDGIWYVTTSTSGLLITRDGGQSWEAHLSGQVSTFVIHPGNPSVIYAAIGSTVYWSLNKGASWMVRNVFPDTLPGTPFDTDCGVDSILVRAADGTEFVGLGCTLHSSRIYKSLLAGAWDIVFESPIGYRIWDMVEDPVSGAIMFSTEDASHAANAVVMRSTDGGDTWLPIPELTGGPASGHGLELAFNPTNRRLFFLEESSDLNFSDDGGATWRDGIYVDFGLTVLVDPACPNRVFGGEFVRGVKVGGVYVSETGGLSFTFHGPAYNTISGLALTDGGNTLLAVARGVGIWEQDLTGLLPCSADLPFFADGFEAEDTRNWSGTVGGP